MNTKRLLLSVTLLLSINVFIVLYLLNASSSSSYNIKITNQYHVIYNNNFDFIVKSADVSPSTNSPSTNSPSTSSPSTNSPSLELHWIKYVADLMIPTFMEKTSTDNISMENQLLLDYDYNKKNETGLPYIFERMFTFFIYSL